MPYLQRWNSRLIHLQPLRCLSNAGSAKDDDDEYNDEDVEADGLDDPLCMDLHPLCLKWADSGECEANPNYMVGSTTSKGHCRKSCGVCTPRKWGAALGVDPVVDTSGAYSSKLWILILPCSICALLAGQSSKQSTPSWSLTCRSCSGLSFNPF